MSEEKKPRVNFEKFKHGLSFIKDSIDQKKGELDFGPKGINFHFQGESPPDELENKYGIQVDDINEITEEVLEITEIILSGEKNRVISNLKEYDSDLLQTFKDRCKLVEKELIDLELTRKYFLQTNYKTALLDKVDWDIIVKRIKQEESEMDFPSAMVRIRIKKPFTDKPPVPKTETIVFESTINEIEDLINELNEIKKSLKKEEERLKR